MRTYSGTNTEEVLDLETDPQGNTYSCGHFSGYSSFGSLSLTATNLSDGFVCKLDPAGTPIWAIKLGGSGFDRVVALAIKPSGNIIATGVFDGSASIGSFQLSSLGNTQDIFVAEIQPDGSVLWANSISGDGQDIVTGMCVDAAGKTFVSAQFRGNITVGNSSYSSLLNDTTHQPSYDILFFRLDNSGQVEWSLQGADHYDSRGLKAVADAAGNYYALIEYSDTLTFQNQSLLPGGVNGIALLKLNNLGKLDWTKRFLSPKSEPNDITLKGDKIYVAGNFSGSLHLPDNGEFSFPTGYSTQYFVASFNFDGTLVQHVTGGSDNFLRLTSVAIDNENSIYVGGNFGCSFTELSTLYGSGVFNSAGYQDIWYGKINVSGQKLWFQQYGGRGQDELWDMELRDIDRPLLGGSFERKLNIPVGNETGNLGWGSRFEALNQPLAFCSTTNYRVYRQITATGNKDGFIIDWHSPGRAPYDYYWRSSSTCNRNQIPSFINPDKDTILSCQGTPRAVHRIVEASIQSGSPPSSGPDREHGPEFNYTWNGVPGNEIFGIPNYTGNVYLEVQTKDGCFTFRDTTYLINLPAGSVNITSKRYEIIQLANSEPGECSYMLILPQNQKDTLEASINNSQFDYHWRLPSGEIRHGKTLEISSPGLYQVSAEVDDSLCLRSRCLKVIGIAFDSLNEAILDGLIVPILDIPGLRNDTLYICNTRDIRVNLVDSLTGLPIEIPLLGAWASTGLIELETGYTFIKHVRRYRDNTTGWNTVKLDLYVPGRMQQYLIRLTKQFYTVVGTASSTVGYTLTPTEPTFCLGKPLKVIIDGPKPFTRLTYASESNPTVANPLDVDPYSPFFMANGPGTYRIRKDSTDSLTGCTHSITGTVILQTRKAPQITTNPVNGYLCPNDSILLTGSQGTEHVWYGPTGEGAPGNRTIYAYAPGNYAYAYTDSFGCRLTSGTIIINEYRVPPLSAEKNHLCPGDSIKISIITYPGLQYVWNNPAGVVKPFIYAKTPGYYSASYTFCGLTQTNGVQISGSTQITGIIADKDKFCEGDSVLLRARYPGWSNKWLPSGKDTSAIYLKQDGTITLRSVDPNGCTTQATLQVDFRSLPAPPELLNPGGPYCAGTVSRLEANGSGIIWLIDGDTLNGNSIDLHIPADTFQVHLKSVDPFSGCEGGTISVDIIGRPPIRKEYISGDTLVCTSEEIQLYPSDYQGDIKRTWYMPGGSSIVSDTLFAPAGSLANLDKIILETGPDPAWCGIQRDTATMYLLPAAKISGIPDSLTACAGESILLSPETIDQNASYTWNGPPLMQVNGPELIISELDISNTGIFTLSAQLDNCNTSKNIVLRVNPIPEPTNLDFSGKFCQGDSVVVTAEIPPDAENYYWVFSGDTLHSNELPLSMSQTLLNKQGAFHYSLRNCPSGPVYFDVSQVYEISSGLPDTLIRCKDELVYLELTSEVEWSEIMWSTGVTSRTIHFPAADGPIYVEAYSSQGCLVRDSVYIRAYPCSIITENVFTPDGDGINDLFLFPNDGVVHQTVVIFNRWGNLVWQSGGTSLAWDGKDKSGVNVVEGTYFYLADIEFINGNSQQSKGTITLIY